MRAVDIRRVVLLFLGGCHPAEAPVVGIAPVTDASVPLLAPDAAGEPLPDHFTGHPGAMCNAYKHSREGTANDPRKLARNGPLRNARPSPLVHREPNGNVQCLIVWENKDATAVVSVAPTCCPSPMPHQQPPCPPPHDETLPSHEAIAERVIFDADGKIVTSTIEWYRHVEMPPRHMCGRRPQGFALLAVEGDEGSIAATLVEMALLEAASIAAFERLERELEHHGAPADLSRRARRAREDEVRHARAMAKLARRFGARVRFPRLARLPVRPLVDVARENLVEGCVRETFGAAIATLQGERAELARETFAAIAEDEREHARLAWDVHAWCAEEMDGMDDMDEMDEMDDLRRQTVAALDHAPVSDDVRRWLGLPSPSESRALLAMLALG